MILIIGGNGQLGSAMAQVFRDAGEDVVSLGRDNLDISNSYAEVSQISKKYHPDCIINCAAYNQVEMASSEIELAYAVNAFGPYWLAQAAASIDALFIHFSTDYVFDGSQSQYRETDCPHPINVYGASKLAGEQLVLATHKKSIIIRTSWLFGSRRESKDANFVASMLSKVRDKEEIAVVNDQIGSPSFTSDVAQTVQAIISKGGESGIYHVTNSGFCSWYEFAKAIFDIAGISIPVKPITTKESGTRIRRPQFSVLENYRLAAMGIPPLRHWKDALRTYLSSLTHIN